MTIEHTEEIVVRERFDPPKYIDIPEKNFSLVWKVNGGVAYIDYEELKNLSESRENCTIQISALDKERKQLDLEIQSILSTFNADGVIMDDSTTIDRIYNGGQRKWDANYLRKILTPEQLARARKTGKPYDYLSINFKADKIIAEMRDTETIGEKLVRGD